jgi:anti-sigma regulatory factor (Ser/Thr protein kinase)
VTRHSKTFPARTDQVGQARRFLAGLLGDRDGATGAITCMSELAANACLHSVSSRPGGTFTVHVLISEDDLRIEVSDEGGPWKPGDGEDEWPHGLAIVAALATESGVTGDEKGGRTAWATFCHAGANRE